MSGNKVDKNSIWIYAVVLFASAFIILLLTAYSQLKLTENYDDYKKIISNQEKANNDYKFNLESAQAEIKSLKNKLKNAEHELSSIRDKEKNDQKNINKLSDSQKLINKNYKFLLDAIEEYYKGNLVQSAITLKGITDSSLFDKEMHDKYLYYVEKTYKKASKLLYIEGTDYYNKEDYSTAIKKFSQSIDLSSVEYFSDDCYYFKAYSEYWSGNIRTSQETIKALLNNYPESSYKKDAQDLLLKMEKK